jgi:hypothetical protein
MAKSGGPPFVAQAQVVSLKVRPSQVSHLCFETGGILGDMNAQLGASVTAYSFSQLYSKLPSSPAGADPSKPYYGPSQIQSLIGTNALASLRAEGVKTALSKAINARQNAYFAKYGHIGDIVSRMTRDYGAQTVTDTKAYRLGQLQRFAELQVGALKDAYDSDHLRKLTSTRKGVVTHTTSHLNSESQSNQKDKTMIGVTSWGDTSSENPVNPPADGNSWPNIDGGGVDDSSENADIEEGTSQTTQQVYNTDYAFRHPYYECEAQYQRAQVSLLDQQFAQFMATLNLKNLSTVLGNELSNIDGDVYRLQVAYANTLLMSPIGGVVTGLYKYPGDPVRAGEPVLRVEDNQTIFLEGVLVYPNQIIPNVSTVQVTTIAFGNEGGFSPFLTGKIVTARGHAQENQWSVIIQCDNPDELYPLGYQFDFDDTTVTITT